MHRKQHLKPISYQFSHQGLVYPCFIFLPQEVPTSGQILQSQLSSGGVRFAHGS